MQVSKTVISLLLASAGGFGKYLRGFAVTHMEKFFSSVTFDLAQFSMLQRINMNFSLVICAILVRYVLIIKYVIQVL